MFTGLVEEVGEVVSVRPVEEGVEFEVDVPDREGLLAPGDSVAVDGVCQTVIAVEGRRFRFSSVRTTLERTTLSQFGAGRRVNLERSLRAGDRLGGHLVQGHVDGVGEVLGVERRGEGALVRIRLPSDVARCTVPRGSVAIDGVSLTVSELEGEVAEIAIIPYTWCHTALDRLSVGASVNVEADLVGKYVDKLLRPYAPDSA